MATASTKSVRNDSKQVERAVALIQLGARLQVLESEACGVEPLLSIRVTLNAACAPHRPALAKVPAPGASCYTKCTNLEALLKGHLWGPFLFLPIPFAS
jgi:hypothetical protein